MIFDCHTHVFGPDQVGGEFLKASKRAWGDQYELIVVPEMHWETFKDLDGAVVLAFNCPATGVVVPDEYVANYVQRHKGKLFGFSSVNPHDADAPRKLEYAVKELGLVGLKLAPIYQNFYPEQKEYFPIYAKAQELGIPIMWHQGTSFIPEGFLDASRPAALDPIARAYPELKMIIAHLGHPWCSETVSVIRKNPNVYADMSALAPRPWQFYTAMVSVMEYGVPHKVLFGSDYGFFTPGQTIDAFRRINDIVEGTNLPRIPEQVIESIIHRNTPDLLGLTNHI